MMGKMLLIALVVLVAVALFGILGESLPEGGALRGISDGIRSIGRGIGDVFGGGYGLLPGGSG